MSRGRLDAGWALLLLFLSGAAGLGHQLLWTRRMVDVLGAGPGTFARVVGVFFVGLAVGSAWAAWRAPTSRNGWRQVAWAEGAVAVLSVLLVASTAAGEWLRGWVGSGVLGWVLPPLLVGPPAVAMGRVFPAVVAALDGGRPGTLVLYVANTAGGIVGLAWVTVWALPRMGSDVTALTVALVNVVVGLVAAVMQSRVVRIERGRTGRNAGVGSVDGGKGWGWRWDAVAFGSGLWVVGLEVVFQQQFAQVTIHSQFSGAVVLTAVLVGLVLGSVWVVWRGRGRELEPECWAWAWWVAGLAAVLGPHVLLGLRPGLASVPYALSTWQYPVRVAGLGLVVMVPAMMTAGMIFPVLLKVLGSGAGSGGRVARMLAVNGVGGWLGAELMSGWMLPRWGLWVPMGWWAVVAVGLGMVMGGGGRVRWAWGLGTGLLMGWMGWGLGRLPQVSPVAGAVCQEVRVGREGVVGVMHRGEDDWWITFNNTYTLGGSRAQMNQERQAHLPLLLHGAARTVGLLGLATGSTAGGAVLHPGVERIVAAELSPAVVEFAAEYFSEFNRRVLEDPRVEVVLEDARLMVRDRPGQFDVVVGDLYLPWRTGEGRLFTREHFAAVRRSLKPDGLYCQWLPCFQLTRAQFDAIARTFAAEFSGGFVVRGDFYADMPILGLVAHADGRGLAGVDWDRVDRGCGELRKGERGRVMDGLVRHVEGVAMCVVGRLPDPGVGPVNTLSNGWLEWDAGRNIVGMKAPWFIGVAMAEYVRGSVQGSVGDLPERLRMAHDSGQFFLTLDVASRSGNRFLGPMRAQVGTRLPASLREDGEIRWEQWPGAIKPESGGADW